MGVSAGFGFQLLGGNVVFTAAIVFIVVLRQITGGIAQRHGIVARDLVVVGAGCSGCGLCRLVTRIAAIALGIAHVGGSGCCIVCSLGQRHRCIGCPGFDFGCRRIGVSSSIGSISDGGIVNTDL